MRPQPGIRVRMRDGTGEGVIERVAEDLSLVRVKFFFTPAVPESSRRWAPAWVPACKLFGFESSTMIYEPLA